MADPFGKFAMDEELEPSLKIRTKVVNILIINRNILSLHLHVPPLKHIRERWYHIWVVLLSQLPDNIMLRNKRLINLATSIQKLLGSRTVQLSVSGLHLRCC